MHRSNRSRTVALVAQVLLWAGCAASRPARLVPVAPPEMSSESRARAGCETAVLVAFHSRDGHTAQLARAVAEGARAVAGVRVDLLPIAEVTEGTLLAADAIVLGSPVYNGNPTAEILKFVESWPFEERPFEDRVGAAFVTAGGMSAGEEGALHSLHRSLLTFGMVVVGGADWQSAYGASAVVDEAPFEGASDVAEPFLAKGRGLGRRVATVARQLRCPG